MFLETARKRSIDESLEDFGAKYSGKRKSADNP